MALLDQLHPAFQRLARAGAAKGLPAKQKCAQHADRQDDDIDHDPSVRPARLPCGEGNWPSRSGVMPYAALSFGLASIDFRLSTSDFAPGAAAFVSLAAPSSLAWLSTMFDSCVKGAAILPVAISAIGLPSFAACAATLRSSGKTMSTSRSIDCSKSFLLISSAPPVGTRLAA